MAKKRKMGGGLGPIVRGMDAFGAKDFQAGHGLIADSGHRYPSKPKVIDARRKGNERVLPDSPGISPQRPVKSLDMHMDLLRWVTSSAAREQRMRWWALYYGSGQKTADIVRGGYFTQDQVDEQIGKAGEIAGEEERQMLARAMTIHVTSEMAELTHLLAHQQPIRPLRSTDLWAPSGFIVLPDEHQLEYWTPDGENNERVAMPIKAVAWAWSTVGRYVPDDTKPSGMGMVHTQGVKLWVYATVPSMRLVYKMGHVTARDVSVLPLMDMSGWAVDSQWEEIADDSERGVKLRQKYQADAGAAQLLGLEDGALSTDQDLILSQDGKEVIVANPPYVSYLRKWIMSFWRLLDEEVAVARPERPDRPAQKRAQRLGRVPNDGDIVRVVRLRRIVDIDSGEPMPLPEVARRFTHRWRVKAFWRHLQRGMGLLDGNQLILDANWPWEEGVNLRLTDEQGLRERVTIETAVGGIITLRWTPNLRQGFVEVERMAWVREHTRGAHDGMLIERYDVVTLER